MSSGFCFVIRLLRLNSYRQPKLTCSLVLSRPTLRAVSAPAHIVVNHRRINHTSFVFFAVTPALSSGLYIVSMNILWNTPSILSTLQDNERAILMEINGGKAFSISCTPTPPCDRPQIPASLLRRPRPRPRSPQLLRCPST